MTRVHAVRMPIAMLIAAIALAACGGELRSGDGSALPSGVGAEPTSAPSGQRSAEPTLPGATASPGVTLQQPWATATLIDVTTGQPFRIADLHAAGSVVFVETMAIWCSNCRRQQVEATTAFESLDPARVRWVGLDVEASETADALARYRDQNGFPFTYAIAGPDIARALVAEFGEVVLSPPNVNTIVIGTDGRVTQLRGHHSADQIRQLAADHGA